MHSLYAEEVRGKNSKYIKWLFLFLMYFFVISIEIHSQYVWGLDKYYYVGDVLLIFVSFFILILGRREGDLILPRNVAYIFLCLFAVGLLFSSILVEDNLLKTTMYLAFLIFFYPMVLPRYFRLKDLLLVYIFMCVFIVFLVVINDFSINNIFKNRNNFAKCFSLGGCAALAIALISREKRYWLYMGIFFFCALMVVISTSRTALFTLLIAFVMFEFFQYSIAKRKNEPQKKKKIILTILAAILVFLIFYQYFQPLLERLQKLSGDRTLSERTQIWEFILQNANAFGHGTTFVAGNAGRGSHSTYFQILGAYGVVALVFFLMFLAALICKAFSLYCKVEKNAKMSAYIAAIIIYLIVYCIYGYAEDIFLPLDYPALVFYICVGYIFHLDNYIRKQMLKGSIL